VDNKPVARGQHVACDTMLFFSVNTFKMRNVGKSCSLAKPRYNAKALLETHELFIYRAIRYYMWNLLNIWVAF